MTSAMYLKLKIIAIVSGVALLLQSTQGFSSTVECGDTIKSLDQSPILDSQSIDQKIQNLAALKLSIDLAKADGSESAKVTALNANYKIKEKELVTYLAKNEIMTRKQLIEKIKQQISVLQRQNNIDQETDNKAREKAAKRRKEQERQIKESVVDGTRAISHRIKPDSFMMGEVGKQKSVTLTKSFDMMATATTQLFYKAIATLANTRFPSKYNIDVDPSEFKGDLHPVERVTYEEVQTWITALNELSQAGEATLIDLIPGHKQGDVYRLPTEAEWEFVIRGRGTLNETYHFGDQETNLKDYAWYNANSGNSTHPVAQKLPLIVDGKEFFDMHGNVWEWVHDLYSKRLAGGIDPKGPEKTDSNNRIVRGGSWNDNVFRLPSAFRNYYSPSNRYDYIGFRLVRIVE